MRQLGKYRLLELVASGGMAEVYRAEMPGPEGFVKQVALKVIRSDHAAGSDFVGMFIQEARLASRLAHANIVQVFDFDRVEGRYLIAMEYVHGRTLRDLVDACRRAGLRLGLARSVFVASEVAKALSYAHRGPEAGGGAGIVHRDVSPHNVLVSFEGEVKLADFGIARALNATGLTAPGTVKGKVAYMAPEQARGERVDARADVFSLGVVLWELVAGRRLFARDTDAATLAAVLSSDPVSPPSEWNEEASPELDAAVMGALERDPERRTRCADDLAGALAAVLLKVARAPEDLALGPLLRRIWPQEAVPPRSRAAPETVVRPDLEGSTETATPPARAGRRVWGAVAAAALLAGVAVAAWPRRPGRTPGPAETSPPAAPADAGGDPADASASRAAATDAWAPVEPGAGKPPGPPGESAPLRVLARSARLRSLPLPTRASGEGILSLNAAPWASVYVGGERLGDTPLELRVPAGRYAVRLEHPTLRPARRTVEVRAGERALWAPALSR